MSNRSAQCSECTAIFNVESPTGRLPDKCPKCREEAKAKERPAAARQKSPKKAKARKPKRSAKRAAAKAGSVAIAAAKVALQEEIEEAQVTSRREALEALEAVA